MLQAKSWKQLESIHRSLVAWLHSFKKVLSLASPSKGLRQPTGKIKYFQQRFNFVVRVHICTYMYLYMYISSVVHKTFHLNCVCTPVYVYICEYTHLLMSIGAQSCKLYKDIGAKRWRVEELEKMVYIPILETLKAVLQNKSVVSEVHIHVHVHAQYCVDTVGPPLSGL